jgi:hypothetical protein
MEEWIEAHCFMLFRVKFHGRIITNYSQNKSDMALKFSKYDLLMFFYKLTRDQAWFHELFRKAFLKIIPSLVNVLLDRYGKSSWVLIPRHSLIEKGEFNLFMSDLDFSLLVNNSDEVKSAKAFCAQARRNIPNLGEIEIYTKDERLLLERYVTLDLSIMWRKLQLIRKWSWISEVNKSHEYHEAKRLRARDKISRIIGIKDYQIKGNELFPNDIQDVQKIQFQSWSHYLSCWISNHQMELNDDFPQLNIFFSNGSQASLFHLAMPTEIDSGLEAGVFEKLRIFGYLQEALLVRASLRQGRQKSLPSFHELHAWHEKLENKLREIEVLLPELEEMSEY